MAKEKIEIPKGMVASGGYEELMEAIENVGTISIRPYVDPSKENMGLEKYDLVLFPHTKYSEDLTCVMFNGTLRYISGLDEFAPEVMNIKDPDEKASKIKTIREVVSYLEKILAANDVDPEDKDFWNKVKVVKPDNHKFWGNIKLEIGNEIITLNPKKNPNDLILYMAIEAGGFSIVAPSYEFAKSSPVEKKFFLDKRIVTASNRATYKKLRNKAVSLLDGLYEKQQEKMLYIAKILDAGNASYKKSTPKDLIYDFLDDYINGNSFEKNKQKSAQDFINVCELDMETLKLRAIIKDAIYFRIIVPKPDGSLYHMDTNSFMGKNNKDVLAYMKNITNEDITRIVINQVEKNW